eukprot:926274-Karenia_brevis.AAC.1
MSGLRMPCPTPGISDGSLIGTSVRKRWRHTCIVVPARCVAIMQLSSRRCRLNVGSTSCQTKDPARTN